MYFIAKMDSCNRDLVADLKSLTLKIFPDKPNNAQCRRDKFVRQLEEQSLLFADPASTTPVHR